MTELLTIADVAERYQVSRRTVERALQRGDIACVHPGGTRLVRIEPEEAARWAGLRSSVPVTPMPVRLLPTTTQS